TPLRLSAKAFAGALKVPKQLDDAHVEGVGDLVERRDRGAGLGALDLAQQRDGQVGPAPHLLERQLALLAEVPDAGADRDVQLVLAPDDDALLARNPGDGLAHLL